MRILALLYGLAHILIRENWIDRDFIAAYTTGFEAFAEHVRQFTPEHVAALSGLDVATRCGQSVMPQASGVRAK